MISFLRIEPSTDIHLVLDPNFKDSHGTSLRNVPLKIWGADSATLPDGSDGFSFTDVTGQCSFDVTPGQHIIALAGATLSPVTQGTTYLQVRFTDPADNNHDHYHYLVIRVMVHTKLDTWWFGNELLTVFADPNIPHSQPSIYASFDNGAVIADITGHNFVTLTSNDPALLAVATNPAHPYAGRIQGLAPGFGSISGSLMGKALDLQMKTVDLAVANNKILEPLMVNRSISPKERFNIVFIAEGFMDYSIFRRACEDIRKDMFMPSGAPRHSPYNLLADDINVWAAYQQSREEGITTGFRIAPMGSPVPIFNAGVENDFKDVKDLTLQVGLSEMTLEQRGVTDANISTQLPVVRAGLQSTWSADATATALGYNNATVTNEAIDEWLLQSPINAIAQTKDTYYGFIAGNRPGEKASGYIEKVKRDPQNVIIHNEEWVATGHVNFRPVEFTRRLREWLIPNENNLRFPPIIDFRRYAPEIYEFTSNIGAKWVKYLIKKHIAQFNEMSNPPVDPAIVVGQYWDGSYTPAAGSHEVKSDGLVCFLINCALQGRSSNYLGSFIGAIIGSLENTYINDDHNAQPVSVINFETLPDKTFKLKLMPAITINSPRTTSMIAHELGHSFHLGDEYEEFHENGPSNIINRYDNLVSYSNIIQPGVAPNNFPKPVNPHVLPWAILHRVEQSYVIIQEVTITAPDKVTVEVPFNNVDGLKKAKTNNQRVYIRRMITGLPHQDGRQLRKSPLAQPGKDVFSELEIDTIDEALNKVTLKVTAASIPLQLPIAGPENNIIPYGSVLYVPLRDQAKAPISVIRNDIMDFMANTSYGPAVPNGRALTENYDELSTLPENDRLDPVNDYSDRPSVPGVFSLFPYKLIGANEGGGQYVGKVYRAAGACKMRDAFGIGSEGQFCFVCKYLIVSRVNPSKLSMLDREYPIL